MRSAMDARSEVNHDVAGNSLKPFKGASDGFHVLDLFDPEITALMKPDSRIPPALKVKRRAVKQGRRIEDGERRCEPCQASPCGSPNRAPETTTFLTSVGDDEATATSVPETDDDTEQATQMQEPRAVASMEAPVEEKEYDYSPELEYVRRTIGLDRNHEQWLKRKAFEREKQRGFHKGVGNRPEQQTKQMPLLLEDSDANGERKDEKSGKPNVPRKLSYGARGKRRRGENRARVETVQTVRGQRVESVKIIQRVTRKFLKRRREAQQLRVSEAKFCEDAAVAIQRTCRGYLIRKQGLIQQQIFALGRIQRFIRNNQERRARIFERDRRRATEERRIKAAKLEHREWVERVKARLDTEMPSGLAKKYIEHAKTIDLASIIRSASGSKVLRDGKRWAIPQTSRAELDSGSLMLPKLPQSARRSRYMERRDLVRLNPEEYEAMNQQLDREVKGRCDDVHERARRIKARMEGIMKSMEHQTNLKRM